MVRVASGNTLIEVKMIPNGIDGKGYSSGLEVGCVPRDANGPVNPIEISAAQDQVSVSMISKADGFGIVVSVDPVGETCDGIGEAPCDGNNLNGISKTLCDKTFTEQCFDDCGRGDTCDEQNCRSACNPTFTTSCKHYIICTTSQHPEVNASGCGNFDDMCGQHRCCPCDEGWGFTHTQANVTACDYSACGDPPVFEIEYPEVSIGWGETLLPVDDANEHKCFCGQNNPPIYTIVGTQQSSGLPAGTFNAEGTLGTIDPLTGAFTAPLKPAGSERCPIVLIQKSCPNPDDSSLPNLLADNFNDPASNPNVWRLQIKDPLISVVAAFRYWQCFSVSLIGGEPPAPTNACRSSFRDVNCQGQIASGWSSLHPGFIGGPDVNTNCFSHFIVPQPQPGDPPEILLPNCCPECNNGTSHLFCCGAPEDIRTPAEQAADACCPSGDLMLS